MDLDAYFERIGWRGPRAPTAEVLGGIVAQHVRAIPFENFDVLFDRPPKLDVPSLVAKLVHARRGGYCYEHASLMAAVLRELGFAVRTHSARVVMIVPRDKAPRTHMFLSTITGGRELVLDPGFGASAPRVPLSIDGTPHGGHRIARDDIGLALELDGKRLWVSSYEHDIPVDFEMANHFTATHASSPFTQGIMARAYTDDGQIRIRNRDVTLVRGGETQTLQLTDRAHLRELIAQHFGFDLPELLALRVALIPEWT